MAIFIPKIIDTKLDYIEVCPEFLNYRNHPPPSFLVTDGPRGSYGPHRTLAIVETTYTGLLVRTSRFCEIAPVSALAEPPYPAPETAMKLNDGFYDTLGQH